MVYIPSWDDRNAGRALLRISEAGQRLLRFECKKDDDVEFGAEIPTTAD